MTGYIIYSRSAINDFCVQWKFKPIVRQLLKEMVYAANFKEMMFEDKVIKRGQLVSSVKSISELLGRTEQEIKTAIKQLTTNKQLTAYSTNRYTLYTLCNYEEFVLSDKGKKQVANKQLTNGSLVEQQQVNNTNNTNNKINNNNYVCVDKKLTENVNSSEVEPGLISEKLMPDGSYTLASKTVMSEFYSVIGLDKLNLTKRERQENINAVTSRLRTIVKAGRKIDMAIVTCCQVIRAAAYAKSNHGASVTPESLFATNAKFSLFSKYSAKLTNNSFVKPFDRDYKKPEVIKPRFPSCSKCNMQRSDVKKGVCGSCR